MLRIFSILFFGVLSAIALAGCASHVSISIEANDLKSFKSQLSDSDFSGSVLIAHRGERVFTESFGFANREASIAFKKNTFFDIGSLTKQFTAAAIIKLAESNRITLEDKLSDYFENVPLDKANINVHNLMTHSAGFAHGFGLYDVIGREQFVRQALNSELLFIPGEKYLYSNVGYGLLAAIVEKVSGVGWELFIQDNLLEPAGLSNTGYRLINPDDSLLSINYGRDPNALQRVFSIKSKSRSVGHSLQHQYSKPGPRWYMEGAGGFLSTLEDMHRWYLTMRARNVLDKSSWQSILTPHIKENQLGTSYYGYGWAIDSTAQGEKRIFHDGSNGYSYAVFIYFPERDIFIFVATNNKDDMPPRLIENVENLVLRSL